MNPSSPSSKMPTELSASTQQKLNMYAIAASAAGVGILALVQPAEAKIVYTRTNIRLFGCIDLNHDGINDECFSLISQAISGGFVGGYVARRFVDNRVIGHRASKRDGWYASALRAGALIGPKGHFTSARSYATMAGTVFHSTKGTESFFGDWANGGKGVKDRYLGLSFYIKGEVHFGWARINYTYNTMHQGSALLTGYAYETTPRKAIVAGNIVAGKTTGPEEIVSAVKPPHPASLATPKPHPATLGLLAMGAPGLFIWRREQAVGAPSQGRTCQRSMRLARSILLPCALSHLRYTRAETATPSGTLSKSGLS